MSLMFSATSGERVVQMDISSVSRQFIPYVGWVGDENNQTITVETRASFDGGTTWTTLTEVSNRSAVPDTYDDTTETRANLIEITQTLETDDAYKEGPVLETFFIYFPDYRPYISSSMPSLELDIESYNHATIGKSDLPSLAMEMKLFEPDLNRTVDMEMEIPFSFAMGGGAGVIASMPVFSITGAAYAGRIGDIEASLPSMSIESYSGVIMASDIPMLSMSGVIKKTELVDILCQIPAMTSIMAGDIVSAGDIECAFAKLQMAMDSLTGSKVDLSGAMPRLEMINNMLAGATADMAGTMPQLKSRIHSIATGDNAMDAMMTALSLAVESGSISDDILRYVKGKVR